MKKNESYDKKVTLMAKKVLLIAIIFTFLFFGMVYLFIEYAATDFKYEKVTIGKECIYLKYRAYTNDNPELFISTSKSRRINSSTDYIYEYSGCLFYKIQNDTIFIFSGEMANQPPKFKSKIHVIQDSLSNPEFMNLYDTYKTLRYEKFPSR